MSTTPKRIPQRGPGNRATTVSLSVEAHTAGLAIAKAERRSFSGQVEMLILAEARRRGLVSNGERGGPAVSALKTGENEGGPI